MHDIGPLGMSIFMINMREPIARRDGLSKYILYQNAHTELYRMTRMHACLWVRIIELIHYPCMHTVLFSYSFLSHSNFVCYYTAFLASNKTLNFCRFWQCFVSWFARFLNWGPLDVKGSKNGEGKLASAYVYIQIYRYMHGKCWR